MTKYITKNQITLKKLELKERYQNLKGMETGN